HVDDDHLALAGDREVGDRQRVARGLGVRDEDVQLGALPGAGGRGRRGGGAWRTRAGSAARSPAPRHVAAAMLTPASLIAAATRASAPGVFSMSMTRSTAMRRAAPAYCGSAVGGSEREVGVGAGRGRTQVDARRARRGELAVAGVGEARRARDAVAVGPHDVAELGE